MFFMDGSALSRSCPLHITQFDGCVRSPRISQFTCAGLLLIVVVVVDDFRKTIFHLVPWQSYPSCSISDVNAAHTNRI